MNQQLTPDQIERIARSLISASESSLGIEVVTPIVYPNGDCVAVYVEPEGAGWLVHDAGFGAMFLERDGIRLSRSLVNRLQPAVHRYDAEFSAGRVSRKCGTDDLPFSIALVANAVRAIADQAVEARRQAEGDFRIVVAEKLRDFVGKRLRENQEFHGKSGRAYRVSNVVLDEAQTVPIAFVVPLPGRSAVPGAFSEMYDLHAAFPSVANDSVYRDDGDIRPEDTNLLSVVGKVFAYSQAATEFARLARPTWVRAS